VVHALLLWLLVAPPEADTDLAKEARDWAKVASSDPEAHLRLSWIFVEVGLTEAAREEAATAVALAPKSAEAHYRLAIALSHDAYGRFCHRGADTAGAIAELRKAKALDPRRGDIVIELAAIFANDPKRLADAAAEYRAARKQIGDGEHNIDEAIVLIRLGRWAEAMQVADAARKLPPTQTARPAIAAAGAAGNRDEVRRRASVLPDAMRRSALEEASRLDYELRLYPGAAMILEELVALDPSFEKRLDFLRHYQRYEGLLAPAGDLVGIVQRRLAEGLIKQDGDLLPRSLWFLRGSWPNLFDEGLVDHIFAWARFEKDGDDGLGWRVRLLPQQGANATPVSFYVVREAGALRVVADTDHPIGLALRAKSAFEAGNDLAARRWLDWASQDPSGKLDSDPLSGRPFARLWNAGADRDQMDLAIAALLAEDSAHAQAAVPVLAACKRPECDLALALAWNTLKKPREALPAIERLQKKYPESSRALRLHVQALAALGAAAQLRLLASQRLRAHPDDKDATVYFGRSLFIAGNGKGYERELRRLMEAGKGDSSLYNSLAWLSLFLRTANADDVEMARKAVEGSNRRGRAQLNTLAAVLADNGKVAEAHEVLLESWRWMGRDGPWPDDFYILGRIAEQVGRREEAIQYYRQEPAPPPGIHPESSAYVLAQKRLAAFK
jgi:tetratricopeptide (TPR) repeat protein